MAELLPLRRHVAFETCDLDEARERVARVFCPHRLDLERRGPLHARQHMARLGALSLSYIAYGAAVRIDPGALDSFFLIHLVPSGRSELTVGGHTVVGSAACGSVTSPTVALTMRWSKDCAHLVLKIERTVLERHLADLLGDSPARPIEFAPELPVAAGPGAGFRRLIDFVAHELDTGDSLLASPLGIARIEQTLMTGLLTAQPSNYSAALTSGTSPAAPRHVRRAEDYIRAHADEAIAVAGLAAAAGVSVRTLFEGFRRFRGTTPMAVLKHVRLDRVRADLLASAATPPSVTEIALKWGFVHLGRFAQDYRRRFGELPSETLRRAR